MGKTKYLYLNTRDEFFRLDVSRIAWFSGEGNYTSFHLCNGEKGSFLANLSGMQTILEEALGTDASSFARVGKSHIVNLKHVYHISPLRGELVLSDGVSFSFYLRLGKDALRKLKEMYMDKTERKQ